MTPFERPIRPDDVGELIDLSVEGSPGTDSMAALQREGIAALYDVLCEHPCAYLADEVGMGKTYQALGLVALLWHERPDARVLFLSPRQNLQVKWVDEYRRFFASNYRRAQGLGDDRASSVLFREPVHRPVLYDNLRSWTPSIGMTDRVAPFLRHTSFTRPVYVRAEELADIPRLRARTRQRLRGWGLFDVSIPARLTATNASPVLNFAFADAVNARLSAESAAAPYFDLVVVDEAQCLRNPDNQTNGVLFRILRGQVRKWLFMSATPAHGGPGDLPTVLNHYPDLGELLDPALADDLAALQRAIRPILVRRPRRYLTVGGEVGKDSYRRHDPEGWGVRDPEMSPLATLAMGLVQKGVDGY